MIKKLEVFRSKYSISTVYKDSSIAEILINYVFDFKNNKLILFSKEDNFTQRQIRYRTKIYDVTLGKTIYDGRLNDPDLIGLFFLGTFTFQNGYFYYSNSVIKLRYDLLVDDDTKGKLCNTEQIFDLYEDIFDIEPHEKVKLGFPISSKQAHRNAFVFSDYKKKNSNTLFILPYLDERRIYLNRQKRNTSYFYTSVETQVNEQVQFNNALIEEVRI